jgi:hypothetical protein
VPSLTHSSTGSAYAGAPARVSTATVFGRVLFLIAVALGFLAGGTIIGKDLSQGAALACSFGGLAMLLVASFGGRTFPGRRVRHWLLYALALLIGVGLGPATPTSPPSSRRS